MNAPPTVVIAGAGIGGLTAAIALARRGFHVTVVEQTETLQQIGAGIQLSPNASRVLIDLGLAERLKPVVVAPARLQVWNAVSGRLLTSAPLGDTASRQFGAPYWVVHRGDLHAALRDAVADHPRVTLELGGRVSDVAIHAKGVTVTGNKGAQPFETAGNALIGADGLWSVLRGRLGHLAEPRFARHTAWRALLPADMVSSEARQPDVNLWLGRHAHLVHYPVRGGALVNLVAILRDDWRELGWSAPGDRRELVARFPAGLWQPAARDLVGAAERWQKWALHDCPPLKRWGRGPVTLLGDAAHPMLPYLAQGAAMAIEDAAVIARCLAHNIEDIPAGLRRYEDARRGRTARAQRAARRNGIVYHMGGGEAFLRTLALLAMRGTGLLRHYRWLYGWKPD